MIFLTIKRAEKNNTNLSKQKHLYNYYRYMPTYYIFSQKKKNVVPLFQNKISKIERTPRAVY